MGMGVGTDCGNIWEPSSWGNEHQTLAYLSPFLTLSGLLDLELPPLNEEASLPFYPPPLVKSSTLPPLCADILTPSPPPRLLLLSPRPFLLSLFLLPMSTHKVGTISFHCERTTVVPSPGVTPKEGVRTEGWQAVSLCEETLHHRHRPPGGSFLALSIPRKPRAGGGESSPCA